jgi:hypothetical protein
MIRSVNMDAFRTAEPQTARGKNVRLLTAMPYPETRANVARTLGVMDGVGALVAPELDVQLVE